ncbi:hypothetical protein T440DRAFT_469841 [Plenodomus tracheiphilus IPT5]|uniref:Uncharacterized protein n=1 Tax=Plenodomus tracheiphilus IPT5 TaxID=1408161 RepID=A0A6A7AZV1_9PLEO|nr:hypothetical protein T440DRAFT_469841 [Plenodomus tracheiphilus IPT5]
MDSQQPPRMGSATHPQRTAQHHPSPTHPASNEHDYEYNEKDAYPRQQSVYTERGSRSSYGRGRDSVISHPFSPKPSSSPSPGSSISSIDQQHYFATDKRNSSTTEGQNIQYPPRAYLDPEKHGYGSSQGRNSDHAGLGAEAVVYDQGKYHEKGPEEKAWQLLFYLSGPCALLSGAITFWTIIALLVTLVLAPLRLCSTRPPLSEQLKNFLAPALNLQLHLVYSHDSATDYSTPMLVVIHLFSPIVAFGVAIAAWTAAGFWFFSSILGDPGGHDGHNDGKESILGVRNWWERWLSRGLRDSSTG